MIQVTTVIPTVLGLTVEAFVFHFQRRLNFVEELQDSNANRLTTPALIVRVTSVAQLVVDPIVEVPVHNRSVHHVVALQGTSVDQVFTASIHLVMVVILDAVVGRTVLEYASPKLHYSQLENKQHRWT